MNILEICVSVSFMCLWAIYKFPRSVCLFCCRKICGPILGMWKLGLRPRNSFSGNTWMGFSLQCSLRLCYIFSYLPLPRSALVLFCFKPHGIQTIGSNAGLKTMMYFDHKVWCLTRAILVSHVLNHDTYTTRFCENHPSFVSKDETIAKSTKSAIL